MSMWPCLLWLALLSPLLVLCKRQLLLDKKDVHQHRQGRRHLPHILHVGSQRESDMVHGDDWKSKNPGWKVDVLTDERIRNLTSSFEQAKPFLQPGALKFGVELADLGRLLALEAEGGVYVDDDVQDLLPIDQWEAQYHYQQSDPDLILGIEFMHPSPTTPFQLTNWAMAAQPGSSILNRAILKILEAAPSIPDVHENIKQRFGPAALTSAILDIVKEYGMPLSGDFLTGNGQLFNFRAKNSSEGNLLILPYRAFSFHGDPKQNQTFADPAEDRLVRHMFRGSWK